MMGISEGHSPTLIKMGMAWLNLRKLCEALAEDGTAPDSMDAANDISREADTDKVAISTISGYYIFILSITFMLEYLCDCRTG